MDNEFIVQNGNIGHFFMSKNGQPINISHIINFCLHYALKISYNEDLLKFYIII